jgi:hypothetical protein
MIRTESGTGKHTENISSPEEMSFVDERRLLLRDFVGDEVVRTDILKA